MSTLINSHATLLYLDQLVTSAPNNLTLIETTTSSVAISWQQPDVIVSDVIYYSICIRETNENQDKDCQTMIVESTLRSAVIYGLKPDTSYSIKIRAQNLKRPGRYCEEVTVKTKGIVE